ncbi:hypothetical protein AB5I41_14350 [Sphingomonas sp. MMS24-JH45]
MKLGYVRLEPDPVDARARTIALTPYGEALIADLLRLMDVVRSEAASLVGRTACVSSRMSRRNSAGDEAGRPGRER